MKIEFEATLIDWEDVEDEASDQHRVQVFLNGYELAVVPVKYRTREGWCPATLETAEDQPALDHAALLGAPCPKCGGILPSIYGHGDDRSFYESEAQRIIVDTLGPLITGRLLSGVPLGVTS